MDEGPLPAATYMAHRKFASRAPELDEMFNRIAATRRESLILRAVAASLRADSYNLKLASTQLASQSAQIRGANTIKLNQEEPA